MPTAFHHALDRGDRHLAAEWLVRHHSTAVLALCEGFVRDSALAQDLCQDAFMKALGGLDGFRRESEPRTWLLAIARNRCLDELRRQGRNPVDTEEFIDDAPDERPLESHLLADRQVVAQALAGLQERDRAMVLLRFVHGLGYPELADAFNVKQGTARMRISRALARMRLLIEHGSDVHEERLERSLDLDQGMDEDMSDALPAASDALPLPPAAAPAPASRSQKRRRSLFPKMSRSALPAAPPPPTLGSVLRSALPPSLAARLDALVAAQ